MMPQRVGRYELIERIGAGGAGEVWRARLPGPHGVHKTVAVKLLRRGHAQDSAWTALFVDEARVSVGLAHPNVVQVTDFDQVDGQYLLAMELVEGHSLLRMLQLLAEQGRVLPVDQCLYIGHELYKGLDYAHGLKDDAGRPLSLVHQDICPSNILLSWAGEVRIADFGIARSILAAAGPGHGPRGHVAYMSPEQASSRPMDARSDQFSAAIVLFELLAGRRLFHTGDTQGTLAAIRRAAVPRPSDLRTGLPDGLDALLLTALAADPDQRHPDCRSMVRGLRRLLPQGVDELREGLSATLEELRRSAAAAELRQQEAATVMDTSISTVLGLPEPTEMGSGPVVMPAPDPAPALPPPTPAPAAAPWPWALAALAGSALLAMGTAAILVMFHGEHLTPQQEPALGAPTPQVTVAAAPEAPTAAPPPEAASPEASPEIAAPSPPRPSLTSAPAASAPRAAAEAPPPQPGPEAPPAPAQAPTPATALAPAPAPAPVPAPEPSPSPAAESAAPVPLTVRLNGGAGVVWVDGRKLSPRGGSATVALLPGPHWVEARQPSSGLVLRREVVLQPGQPLTVDFDLP